MDLMRIINRGLMIIWLVVSICIMYKSQFGDPFLARWCPSQLWMGYNPIHFRHNLGGGLEHLLFFHISGIIIPIDFHILPRGSNQQPVIIYDMYIRRYIYIYIHMNLFVHRYVCTVCKYNYICCTYVYSYIVYMYLFYTHIHICIMFIFK